MIELVSTDKHHFLQVDGVAVCTQERAPAFRNTPYFHLDNATIRKRIFDHSFEEFPPKITFLGIYLSDDSIPTLRKVSFEQDDRSPYAITFNLDFDFENWAQQWSISQYGNEILQCGNEMWKYGLTTEQDDELISNGIKVNFPLPKSGRIADYIESCLLHIRELHDLTILNLTKQLNNDTIVIRLKLPKEIKTPCEQYLLYFSEFLKDIGIETDAGIKHEGLTTIFSIKPTDKSDALDKIHQALEAYLAIPSKAHYDISLGGDITTQKLWANIQHLKGQLTLAEAIIEAKNATIEAQRRIPDSLNLQTFLAPTVNTTAKQEDQEDALGGILIFKRADTKLGVSISLAEIVRRIKKLFH